ncbi:hypothetical protein HYALB_00003780 [Hymenoscyphus albidus]|uniref:Uncharacterized protein n=1 Tax=Hymenoscyphus albidus TaxID=595503 RepID=A0A9N9LYI5_9HELO|nr:hypothetical protein HYALB_00003780 [Hymenoscyphus albidus]
MPPLPPFPGEIEAVLMESGSKIFAKVYDRFRRAEYIAWIPETQRIFLKNGEDISLGAFKLRTQIYKEIEIPMMQLEKCIIICYRVVTLQILIDFLSRLCTEFEGVASDRCQQLPAIPEGFVAEKTWTQVNTTERSIVNNLGRDDILLRLSRYSNYRVASMDTGYSSLWSCVLNCKGIRDRVTGDGTWVQTTRLILRDEASQERIFHTKTQIYQKHALVAMILSQTGQKLRTHRLNTAKIWRIIQHEVQKFGLFLEMDPDAYLKEVIDNFLMTAKSAKIIHNAKELLQSPYSFCLKNAASFYEKYLETLCKLELELLDQDVLKKGLPVLSAI